ncbi:MAG: sigma-70 family RNA polymerase sigma factor [Planctomycetes bacterium]|nr:sigma-70 family RNA polymerase sigma factor [Planctomycetota bacterium]
MSAAASLNPPPVSADISGRALPGSDTDVRLMERIRDGDQDAVITLVERFQNELVGFFYHQCWDQLVAEELAQDVFVNVYRSRSRYQATAKVRTYLYRIAHNLWIDHLRRQKRHLSIDAEFGEQSMRLVDVLKAPDAPEDTSGRDHQVRTRIHEALENLPEGQREVFVLANNHGMKYQEIAAILHIPEGTVKSRMHNAVRALRDELTDLIEP